MVAAYRDSISGTSSDTSIEIGASGLTCVAGDILILHVMGYTSIGNPSGSDVTWTEVHVDTQTTPFSATGVMRVFWGEAPDNALSDFTCTNGENDQWGYMLTSISGADTTTPIDAQAINSGTGAAASTVCPSVSPTGEDSLLVSGAATFPGGDGDNYTAAPSGVTLRENVNTAFDFYAMGTEALTASGATGTRTWDPTDNHSHGWIGSSVAIASAAAGGGNTVRYGMPTLGVS